MNNFVKKTHIKRNELHNYSVHRRKREGEEEEIQTFTSAACCLLRGHSKC